MAKIKTEINLLREDEIGQWGVFISHSGNSDMQIQTLCTAFDQAGIRYLWDQQISLGAKNFADEIYSMIYKCSCAVVVINQQALHSQWVNFEVGLLDGLGKRIFLYDQEQLLSKLNYRYHYDKFCPAYTNIEALTEAIQNIKMFYPLFNHATAELTNDLFYQKIDQYVVPVRLSLNIPGLSSVDSDTYQLKALIINFGNFTGVRYHEDAICFQTMEPLSDNLCEQAGTSCCLNYPPDRRENPECVLLNFTWEKTTVDGDNAEIILPLHRTRGTTFKLFADTESGETADQLQHLLNQYGTCASLSKSGTQNRVYFSLRSSPINGVFRLKDPFSNNFICPGSARL